MVLGFPTPPLGLPLLRYYDRDIGTVTDARGLPVLATPQALTAPNELVPFPPNALRSRERFYALDGLLPSLEIDVDFLGNVKVDQRPTAPIGISVSAARLFLHAHTTTATLSSNTGVFLGSEGSLLSRSGVPGSLGIPQPFVLGTVWALGDLAMNVAKIAGHGVVAGGHTAAATGETTAATAYTALIAALAALVAGPPPITDPDLLKVIAAITAFATAGFAAATATAVGHGTAASGQTALATAITAYQTAGLPTHYLSTKVFGE
jgi:hypothetical protein